MTRVLAATLVVVVGFTMAMAQEREPIKLRMRSGLGFPFEITEQDGKTAWRVSGSGEVGVDDLLNALADATDTVVVSRSLEPSKLGSVSYIAPESGTVVANVDLTGFVADLLWQRSLALIPDGDRRLRLIAGRDAFAWATFTDEENLDTFPEWQYVSIVSTPSYIDSQSLFQCLRMLSYGGNDAEFICSPTVGSGLALAGRAGQVRQMLKVAKALDTPDSATSVVRSYSLPAEVDLAIARVSLLHLFPNKTKSIAKLDSDFKVTETSPSAIAITTSPNSNSHALIVHASAADHEIVAQAIEAMKN